ncbi:MAG: hypothetical protein VX777_10855 [Chlamydiota bacterium]|nr:hypothetical protein [Chlamydiota bacterium]
MIEWVKKILESGRRDPLLFGIIIFVLCGHGYVLHLLAQKAPISIGALSQPKKLVVQTVKFKENRRPEMPKKIAQVSPPKKQPKPVVSSKKSEPKPVQKSVKKVKSEVVKKVKPDNERQKLLRMAQESIAKIEQRSDKLESTLQNNRQEQSLPQKIETLSAVAFSDSATSQSGSDKNYKNQLATRLRSLLQLPEYGDVEIMLSLARDGKVKTLKVIKSESSVNSRYVEETLPNMVFLPFGNSFEKNQVYTFHITLTNE